METKYIIRNISGKNLYLKGNCLEYTFRAREAKRFDLMGSAMAACANLNRIFGATVFTVIPTNY